MHITERCIVDGLSYANCIMGHHSGEPLSLSTRDSGVYSISVDCELDCNFFLHIY